MMRIYGLDLDQAGRCVHYHLSVDVTAMKCARCQRYYACYQCHDALENYRFAASNKDDWPVMCGICGCLMRFDQYQLGTCPRCGHAFNPKCSLHGQIYFK